MNGTRCTICNEPRRSEIDNAILAGTAVREIARTFGLNRDAIGRHARAHTDAEGVARRVSKARRRAVKALAASQGPVIPLDTPAQVLDEAKRLYGRALALMDAAQNRGDGKSAERMISPALAVLEKVGKAMGMFSDAPVVNIDASTKRLELAIAGLSTDQIRAMLSGSPIDVPALPGGTGAEAA